MDRANRADRLLHSPQSAAGIAELKELAAQGSLFSTVRLGDVYRLGMGAPKDAELAEQYYRQAADAGSFYAYHMLGRLFILQKRHSEALSALSYASNHGYPPALHWLARMYCQGVGVERDFDRAERLLERAIKGGSLVAKIGLSVLLVQKPRTLMRMLRASWLFVTGYFQILIAAFIEGPTSDRFR